MGGKGRDPVKLGFLSVISLQNTFMIDIIVKNTHVPLRICGIENRRQRITQKALLKKIGPTVIYSQQKVGRYACMEYTLLEIWNEISFLHQHLFETELYSYVTFQGPKKSYSKARINLQNKPKTSPAISLRSL